MNDHAAQLDHEADRHAIIRNQLKHHHKGERGQSGACGPNGHSCCWSRTSA